MKGTTSNIITTGNISFAYTEGDFVGNGIKITNALPISDEEGKILFGANNYFDFSINGNSSVNDVNYEIVVNKDASSTMDDGNIKIYLTEITAAGEVPSELVINNSVKTYSELNDSTKQNGKIVYLGTMKNNTSNYNKKFRLRMWIASDVDFTEVMGKELSVKVNVVAY